MSEGKPTVRIMPRHRSRGLALLADPGPARARAIAAAQASLRRDVGLCGDRARAAATHAIDEAIRAAQEEPR